jgi:hypothetical protein
MDGFKCKGSSEDDEGAAFVWYEEGKVIYLPFLSPFFLPPLFFDVCFFAIPIPSLHDVLFTVNYHRSLRFL